MISKKAVIVLVFALFVAAATLRTHASKTCRKKEVTNENA